ncbi:hypothetical protein UA08_03562 [Talaromyces atroroseus]|uniref:ubiquitinyl hydrolase 1 n=1 Tax=Talaromyces atroroseus TaxID=1441469 RepID=A0A225AHJ9_TALAT|nr:hypothetical protein UA08_03562 [Talaromyces atroroseus]OKL60912.1 hypothetical protein UA08_03562 [Talaromyces atroroseus]
MKAYEKDISRNAALYIAHHVFLPPKLPGSDDYSPECERILIEMLCESLSRFKSFMTDDQHNTIDSAASMLDMVKQVHDSFGHIDEAKLGSALEELCAQGGSLPVHAQAQNAGLIFTNAGDGFVVVEVFELLPRNGFVIQTLGRLRRSFPGRAIKIPLEKFAGSEFLQTAAYSLAKMSHQRVADTKPIVKKAHQKHDEERDATHPKIITELLFAFLQPLGQSVELLFSRNQDQDGPDIYKSFMVFFTACLLKRTQGKLPTDLVHAMQLKISRRLLKLELVNEEQWLKDVQDIMSQTANNLQSQWSKILTQDSPQKTVASLETIDFRENIYSKLPELDNFIKSIGARTSTHTSTDINPRSYSYELKNDELPTLTHTSSASIDIAHQLCAIEMWVATNLGAWLQCHLEQPDTCRDLDSLISSYYKVASSCYSENPEATSEMFLTILELWVALDKSALCLYPILSEYDVGLPGALFDSLLLTSKTQMVRLQSAQVYLSSRLRETTYQSPAIFCDYGGDESFAVRYFEVSDNHQNLRTAIEVEAEKDREKKVAELVMLKREYSELMRLCDESKCRYRTVYTKRGLARQRHVNPCEKCRYKKEADEITIGIHEWPLCNSELKAKATVFETQVPSSFGFWRKTTLYVLFDVFGAKYTKEIKPMNLYHLKHYGCLATHFQAYDNDIRVGLASNAKPHNNTHYSDKNISMVAEEDILLNNGNRYQYYDYVKQTFIGHFEFTDKLKDLCTYKLPLQSVSLQKFLSRPPPNEVISSQSECPSHFALEEYRSLVSIPLGYRIQWQNILLQLAMPAVDYRKQETTLVIFQAIHQAGPMLGDNVLRQGHLLIGDNMFADMLLSNLEDATERLKGNWESYNGFWVFTTLTAKVLYLSPSEPIHQKCLQLLGTLRRISFKWVMYLRRRADESTNNEHKNVLIDMAYRMALICVTSFDCAKEYLNTLLEDPANAKIYLQCAMFMQERTSINYRETNDILVRLLEHRWKRLCHRSASILLASIITNNCTSLNDAISESWPAYRGGFTWVNSESSLCWLKSQCNDDQTVHFNLITGELLMNGSPVGHLPNEYRSHEIYLALFGDAPLEVMLSSEQGMRFVGKAKHSGRTVHLRMEASDLFVRLVNNHGTFELIPRRKLAGKFPVTYVESPGNRIISSVLSSLENTSYIHCTIRHDSSMLEIELPSIDLQFYVHPGEQVIYARQYPGMVIDDNQSLGTLVGLRSRLLLTNQKGSRLLIVPEGDVTWEAYQGHINVYVDKRSMIRSHSYLVDDQLRRLVDNGSLQSKLFLCYLHALTSFCLPDPFTMRTGTEQALSILNSAAVKSFDRLTQENVDLLCRISRMSPGRRYYPPYLREMQVVTWDKEMSFLSQHGCFMKYVKAIFAHDKRMKIFHEDKYVPPQSINYAEDELVGRDCIRSAALRVSGFGAEDHTISKDREYTPRDRGDFSSYGCRTFRIANFIYQGHTTLEYELPSDPQEHLWEFLCNASETTHGPAKQLDPLDLRYDGELIISPSASVSKFWCSFYTSLTRKRAELNKFHVMLWLASMAFSEKADINVLQIMSAFYTLPSQDFPEAPLKSTFDLSKGFAVSDAELRRNMQQSVRSISYSYTEMPLTPEITSEWNLHRKPGFVSLNDIFSFPPLPQFFDNFSSLGEISLLPTVDEADAEPLRLLDQLLRSMIAGCNPGYEEVYLSRLQESLSSLQGRTIKWGVLTPESTKKRVLREHLECSQGRVRISYEVMRSSVLPSTTMQQPGRTQWSRAFLIASSVGQWPRITPTMFLQQLTMSKWHQLSDEWKNSIVSYGIALTGLQRAVRLLSLTGKEDDLIKELQNVGHENWDPRQYPESLLLEIENGIMVRLVQQQIIKEIIDLPKGCNKVMQLNMGEGKSSVIVPILASILADPSSLVRVIVAKPQARQMHHVLVAKLAGLLNRRVYHMPFFRGINPSEYDAEQIGSMCRECVANGGVLLVQPEQLLSFKLMGIEALIADKHALGHSLLKTQHFFDKTSRDVVDESDENFSTKFELVYAMGSQQSIELSPERWLFIPHLLGLVGKLASEVKSDLSHAIEVWQSRPGAFPRTRLLRPEARRELLERISRHICDAEYVIPGLSIHRQSTEIRQATSRYILEREPSTQDISLIQDNASKIWTGTTRKLLLLLRGLLAGGVLPFALEKRWRVAYGLDLKRTPPTKLAVPYRGKDCPTARSEFSDPDTVILLTCLSYYYGGLNDDDLFLAFGHVVKSDQADVEYQLWVEDAPQLDHQFRQLGGMKEFPQKLSASGWDIGEIKTFPTAGFSGTNDSRETLPLSVDQLDLPEQMHTNALVLGYLLQTENSVAIVNPEDTRISGVRSILSMVNSMDQPTQVILDVGAQILESNFKVAKEWLEMTPESRCRAIVFLDDNDEIVVLDRKGWVEPLHISPFAKQMEACYVYLDECHTRGTDLRLPKDYRAAVTLGANLTKDKLVQACMRMRKLGQGQSVVFLIPEEIELKIRSCVSKEENQSLEVSDVLQWAISETMIDTSHNIALWAVQGARYQRQSCIWQHYGGRAKMAVNRAKELLEDDAATLEQRYSPGVRTELPLLEDQYLKYPHMQEIIQRCRQFKNLDVVNASLYEEQERELALEQEREREVQRPRSYDPVQHTLHTEVVNFVDTGELNRESPAFMPAFKALYDTTAAKHLDLSKFPHNHLMVTNDFMRIVQYPKDKSKFVSDLYQRQVQWILTSPNCDEMVIISPFEADQLLPAILQSGKTTLHLYSPRVTLSYQSLGHLSLYNSPVHSLLPLIPRHLITQLNLFAGQVYLSSQMEYLEVCNFLNLASRTTPDGWAVGADGFIISRGGHGGGSAGLAALRAFQTSPVKFFKILMTQIRRHCENYDKTHMGKILNGDLLHAEDFSE